jgi:hypothetical protein
MGEIIRGLKLGGVGADGLCESVWRNAATTHPADATLGHPLSGWRREEG